MLAVWGEMPKDFTAVATGDAPSSRSLKLLSEELCGLRSPSQGWAWHEMQQCLGASLQLVVALWQVTIQ